MSLIPREHPNYPGFYHVPNCNDRVISRDGRVISLFNGKEIVPYIDIKGYLRLNLNIHSKRTQRFLHRLLGLTFIDVPSELKRYSLSKLEINHKNGVKTDNSLDNLEWVTVAGNAQHAHANELNPIGKAVLSRNILTNEIKRFVSIQACAYYSNLERKKLSNHLLSTRQGRVTNAWHVFKYDDDTEWPELPEVDRVENKWDYYGVYVVKEKATGKWHLFDTIQNASIYFKVNFRSSVYKLDYLKEPNCSNDYEIEYFEDVLGKDIQNFIKHPSKRHVSEQNKPITVTNTITGETKTYPIIHLLAKDIKLSPHTLHIHLKNGGGMKYHYNINWA